MSPQTLIISETSINEFCWMCRVDAVGKSKLRFLSLSLSLLSFPYTVARNCIVVTAQHQIRMNAVRDNFDTRSLRLNTHMCIMHLIPFHYV